MVAAGFTGVDDVFSGERNFFEAFAPKPDPDRLVHKLGTRFEICARRSTGFGRCSLQGACSC